jgi:hypothetical protein
MATDSTHLPSADTSIESDSDMSAGSLEMGSVQLAAASPDATIPVHLPQGKLIVVIPVKPGQTIELPTDSPDGMLAKLGADGNLAIVVDGRTIILQGYLQANDEAPVKIVTNDGDVVNITEIIAGTLPDLDIQTAAGPAAAGAQGGTAGADAAGSGIFVPFAAGPLLGGFDGEGVLKATQLAYKNIDDERVEYIIQEEEPEKPNNPPTIDFDPQNPAVKDGRAVVSDEGFGNQSTKDSDPNPADETNEVSVSGTFVVSDPDVGDVLTVALLTDGLPTKLGNDPVTWIPGPDGHTMTGQTNGSDAIVITISSVDGFTYDYDVVLTKPLSHIDPTFEDEIDFNLTVKVTDSKGLFDTAQLAVQIEDDQPIVEAHASLGSTILVTQDAETDGDPTDKDSAIGLAVAAFGNLSNPGADGPGGPLQGSFALGLLVSEGDPSGLTTGGAAIFLYEINGEIVGSTAANKSGVTDGNTVFSVSNADFVVTLTQFQQIDHANDESAPTYDDDVTFIGSGKIGLTYTVSLTDSDGDTASDSVVLDIGVNLGFADDGPSIDVTVTDENSVVLNTQDAQTIGDASDTAVSTADFSGVFKIGTFSHGADGPGTISDLSYVLGFAAGFSEGDASGLKIGGADINLYQDVNGVIIGSTAGDEGNVTDGNTVFTVSVDADGKMTLTQLQQIDHNKDETEPTYDDDEIALAAGKLTLTASATITDFEGDSATDKETIDLGGNLVFDDDGPFIDVVKGTEANILLETYDAKTDGNPTAEDVATSSADFGGVFTIGTAVHGADGPGKVSDLNYDLNLAVKEGTASGLTIGGVSINLFEIGGVIVGSTETDETKIDATDTVFTVAVDSDGKVTLTQFQQIDHDKDETEAAYDDDIQTIANGLVTLTASATVTDGEGDSDTDSETIDLGGNLVFHDDGPSLELVRSTQPAPLLATQDAETDGNPTDTDTDSASFKGVFTALPTFGADGPGAVSDFDFDLDLLVKEGSGSGLTIGGVAINLFEIGGVIVGSTEIDEANVDATDTVFTVSVDGDGKVTLTQYQQIDHDKDETSPTYDDDQKLLGEGKIGLTASATVTDSEGDSATASKTVDLGNSIRFDDDGPSIDVTATSESGIVLNTQDAETIGGASDTASSTADFSNVFKIGSSSYGADGPGTTSDLSYQLGFAIGFAEGDASGLKIGGVDIRLYQDASGLITGSTAATEGGVLPGNTVFTVAVDADGKVTLTQVQQIDHNNDETAPTYDDDEIALAAGKLTLTATATISDSEGDSDTDSATIDLGGNLVFDDDGPSVAANLTVQLDDDDVAGAGGNPGGTNDDVAPANTTGSLQHTFGADGAGSVLMANTGTLPVGLGFTQALSAGDTILTISQNGVPVMRITVTDTVSGAYTVEQLGVIDHPAGDTENNLQFNIAYKVTDSEGDSATGSLVINVDDDTPVAVDDLVEVGTSGSVIGNVLTDGMDDKFGADGQGTPAVTQVVFKGVTFVDGTDGSVDGVIHVTGDFGNLELNTATGAYTYTRTSPVLVQGADTFTYTIQDGDGDTDTADLTLQTSAANILNGVFITNTNSTDQPLVLTFQQVTNPIHFSAKIYSLNAQGQQGTLAQDVGFFIDPTKQHNYSVEAGETTSFTNIIVTDFALEGTDLNAPGGSDNWQIRYDDDGPGSRDTAFTGVFQPSTKTEVEADQPSVDGKATNNNLTDPDEGGKGLDFQFGAAGNDTLTGDDGEADILNGGNGIDILDGKGGNDILVYDAEDVAAGKTGFIDGGTGADVLRIDDGALAIFFGTANNVVNLVGADIRNIEVIGISEEAVSDKNNGTTIKLSAADVLAFADDSKDADGIEANTLYIVGSQGDKVQLASNGAGFIDGDANAGNGITASSTFDDGQGQVFNVYNISGGGKLYVDADVTVTTVA